jgi:LmbE family N-acetylglucosaminyl deacetylase
MGTLVALHAHPDDEALTTGGTLARASAEGHRVVLVVATNGDHGEAPDDLAPGETLVDRRRAETQRSAAVLGVHRVAWLGYSDSGMTGWEQNADPASFHQAPLDEAAARVVEILREEGADVVVSYDWHGNYGHPDHVKAHQVAHRAAELASTPRVFDATMNRDQMVRWFESEGSNPDWDPRKPMDDGNPLGSSEDEITLRVDVAAYLPQKRASILAHVSQVTDTTQFREMTDEMFAAAFAFEWFVEHGAPPGLRDGWLF